ncbi:unnamed protein product [Penicillium nalgiovense]|nr:unnamed protein product [Penicillium nalgiovense]
MKLFTKSRLDSLVSTTALSFTVAVLVDLKEFPKLRDLQIRDSFNIDTARIENGGRNAVEGVASIIHTSANEAIHEATSAAAAWSKPSQGWLGDGLSDPSTSFTFDLSAVLDSTPINLSNILPDIDLSLVSGYRRFSQSVICLYIVGFVVTTLSGVLACRKVFFSKGSRPLAIFCTVCDTWTNIEETC